VYKAVSLNESAAAGEKLSSPSARSNSIVHANNTPSNNNYSPTETAVSNTQNNSVDAFIDSVERAIRKTQSRLTNEDYRYQNKAVAVTQVKKDSSNMTVVNPPVPRPPLSSLVKMEAHYLHDENKRSVSSLEITIMNKSDEDLASVSVDVFYYKRGERLFDKETIYFNNIQAGRSLTKSVPGNKKALTARFQMGQISAKE
jgi:hypothetical protein